MGCSVIVTGIPRSRTKWISELFTACGVMFTHELIDGCRSIHEYKARLSHSGDCNTGLALINPNRHIDCRIVVIRNNDADIESAAKWCNQTYGGNSIEYLYHLESLNSKIKGMHIWRDEIDSAIPYAFEYLTSKRMDLGVLSEYISKHIVTDKLTYDEESARALIQSCM